MASRKEEKEARRQERLRAEQTAEAEARRKKLLTGVGAAALAAIIVVIALIGISQSGSESGSGGGDVADTGLVDEQLAGVPQSGTVLGDAKTEVRVVEYGDLQCPACKQFSETEIPKLISGPVSDASAQLEFRNFTIIGPESTDAAKAALAASEQDRYWQFVELFYRNQGQENSGYVTDSFLTDIATAAGVGDLDAWNASREDPKWDKRLAQTQSQAADFGFTGTPSVAVEGPGGSESLGTFPSLAEIESAINRVR